MAESDTPSYLDGAVPVSSKPEQSNDDGPTIKEYTSNTSNGTNGEVIKTDAVVIGAGFSGITAIDRLRKQGMSVKCFEAGQGFGGTWFWNRYPGARVDSEVPYYQLNIPEVYQTWNFSERFPGHEELRRYMDHIDQTLNLRKDTYLNARVISCVWDSGSNTWTIKSQQGHIAQAKYLLLCTGLLHRTYTPNFPGLNDYKGRVIHSGAWPTDLEFRGKKIGLIGAGATAVQITQELGKIADQLTVFLRRPSYCFPMRQRDLTAAEQEGQKVFLPAYFKAGRGSYTGFPVSRQSKGVLEADEAERQTLWNRSWGGGGFQFALVNFNDVTLNPESNKKVYDFWREQVSKRFKDPQKAAIMAPEKPPYHFGTKRAPLEQDYYEVLDQPNVHIHSLQDVPLEKFTSTGMKMADGTCYDFDAVVLATGFDSYTGSLTQLGLIDINGVPLADRWKDGVSTYLGLTVSGFPNMFMTYSPQSPAPLANGTTAIEAQVEMIVDIIRRLESEGASSIDAEAEAEKGYKDMLNAMIQRTLLPYTDSWWNGANVPSKKSEIMIHIGGVAAYEKQCRETFEGNEWKGFKVIKGAA